MNSIIFHREKYKWGDNFLYRKKKTRRRAEKWRQKKIKYIFILEKQRAAQGIEERQRVSVRLRNREIQIFCNFARNIQILETAIKRNWASGEDDDDSALKSVCLVFFLETGENPDMHVAHKYRRTKNVDTYKRFYIHPIDNQSTLGWVIMCQKIRSFNRFKMMQTRLYLSQFFEKSLKNRKLKLKIFSSCLVQKQL